MATNTRTVNAQISNYYAGGNIYPFRIVAFGNDDNVVVQSTGPNVKHVGISVIPLGREYPIRHGEAYNSTADIHVSTGDRVDVQMDKNAPVELGGNVTRGDWLTSDAQGRAVAATFPLASGVRLIGFATTSGVLGDMGYVFLQPSIAGA